MQANDDETVRSHLMKLVAIDALKPFLCALALATWIISEPAAGGGPVNLNLTCSGNRYLHDDPFPTPESVSLSISGSNPISVLLGKPGTDKTETGSVIVNNDIKLKFVAGPYTGEFFYLTGPSF